MKRAGIGCALAMLALGCSTMFVSREEEDRLERIARRPVRCRAGKECEIRWARALEWVQNVSRWKLRHATDSLITTEGPFDTTNAAFSISKVPIGGDAYELQLRAGCGNIFGCVPSILELRSTFVGYVGSDVAGLEQPSASPAADPVAAIAARAALESVTSPASSASPERRPGAGAGAACAADSDCAKGLECFVTNGGASKCLESARKVAVPPK